MSELVKWFEKRRESKALSLMQRHLATTMSAVEDFEKAVKASVALNEKEAKAAIERVTSAEKEADRLRRTVMTELARGELPPTDREDLMHLIKRVDMVADWCRESTRILNATPIQDVPESLKKAAIDSGSLPAWIGWMDWPLTSPMISTTASSGKFSMAPWLGIFTP